MQALQAQVDGRRDEAGELVVAQVTAAYAGYRKRQGMCKNENIAHAGHITAYHNTTQHNTHNTAQHNKHNTAQEHKLTQHSTVTAQHSMRTCHCSQSCTQAQQVAMHSHSLQRVHLADASWERARELIVRGIEVLCDAKVAD